MGFFLLAEGGRITFSCRNNFLRVGTIQIIVPCRERMHYIFCLSAKTHVMHPAVAIPPLHRVCLPCGDGSRCSFPCEALLLLRYVKQAVRWQDRFSRMPSGLIQSTLGGATTRCYGFTERRLIRLADRSTSSR